LSDTINLKLKILVCEADTRVLKRLESWIKAMGEEALISDDAIVATQMFDDEKPDIIIVSQEIKSMGAIEFIESIKLKSPKQAIILMLNSDVESSLFKRSIDLQVDKYLNMPVDATLLFNAIDALSKEKIWHNEFQSQKRLLQDYKDAVDKSFSVSKHNKDGEIFYVNDAFCKTTKLTLDEAMQGSINPLTNPNADIKRVWNELEDNKIYRERQIFKFDDKQDHTIDITAVAITDENENISEFLVFSNDVTDVINTARKIKEQKLQHEEELNKVKDSFLTVFSHELKTPLNSIINFSEYIKKHLLKEDFKKRDILVDQISQINMSGWHMLDMITNLIDSMKLRDGEIKLVASQFYLHNVIENILDKYKEDLVDIKVIKLFKDEFLITSDEKRVSQLLNNLISNAIKYCKLKIAVVLKANETEFVLEVLDDGDGFGDTSKVFELFEQSNEDSMTRTAQGTGVGLFVSKKLCDAMNFQIEIASSKNLGGARVVIKGNKE